MPILGVLLKTLLGGVYALIVAIQAQNWAVRIAVVVALAATYVACVYGFSQVVAPLFSKLTSTSYGQVIGLAFPPSAGTVLAALIGLWGCILAKRLTVRLLKAV